MATLENEQIRVPSKVKKLRDIRLWFLVRSSTFDEEPAHYVGGCGKVYVATRVCCTYLNRHGWGDECGKAPDSLKYIIEDTEMFVKTINIVQEAIFEVYKQACVQDLNHGLVEFWCRTGLHRSVAMATLTEVLLDRDALSGKWQFWDKVLWLPSRYHRCDFCCAQWTEEKLRDALGITMWQLVLDKWDANKPWARECDNLKDPLSITWDGFSFSLAPWSAQLSSDLEMTVASKGAVYFLREVFVASKGRIHFLFWRVLG